MQLDASTYERARKARDARFDGRFFIGVITTGVYCRPVCAARTPKRENIRYFASAAAAAEAGFRPCLRCRPEAAPGTPAWSGTSATVSRALRLIADSALDDGHVEDLAEKLGIGSRHLRRLFLEHLGATPVAVAQTRRLHFAKKLIDETDLPFTEIAMAAGFGSIRRFNATFSNLYGRTPTQLRALSHRESVEKRGEYRLYLHYRPPFDWAGLLDFWQPRAIPGVEHVDSNCYRRTIAMDGAWGTLEVGEARNSLSVSVRLERPTHLFRVIERVRRMFDVNADPEQIRHHLGADPLLAPLLRTRPGLRVPVAWDGYELAVRAILGQQVTVRAATTLAGRLVREFGVRIAENGMLTHLFPAPGVLAEADLTVIGIPQSRAKTIRGLAKLVADGELKFSSVADPSALLDRLREIPGVGEWTVEYIAMRGLGEPDAFPAADLGLLRAAGMKSPRELQARSESWRPWRAYAAMHLWRKL